MAKSLSGLWLRSLRSTSKTQQAQSRLMKSLLPKPARSPTVRKTPAQLAKPPEGLAKAAKSARKPATQTAPDFATATRMNLEPARRAQGLCRAVTTTHYAGRKPQLVQCDISTLGHAWSGGDDSMRFSTREGPDASLMMWAFFARHFLKSR